MFIHRTEGNGHMKMTVDFLRQRPTRNYLSMPQPEVTAMNGFHLDGWVVLRVASNTFGSDAIQVFDLKGNKVHSQACVLAAGVNSLTLHADLSPGAYLVTLGHCVRKIVWL